MPRISVHLPDDLYREVKALGLSASALLREAVRAELRRRQALEAADEWPAELGAEPGEATAEEEAVAEALVRRTVRPGDVESTPG